MEGIEGRISFSTLKASRGAAARCTQTVNPTFGTVLYSRAALCVDWDNTNKHEQ
jgi:hypothetical protein